MLTTLLLGVQKSVRRTCNICNHRSFAAWTRCTYKRTDLHIRFGLIFFFLKNIFLKSNNVLCGTSSLRSLTTTFIYSLSYMITLLPWAESFHSMQILQDAPRAKWSSAIAQPLPIFCVRIPTYRNQRWIISHI